MIASLFVFTAVLIFATGVLVTGRLAFTVLFLSLTGVGLSVLFAVLGAWYAAAAELVLGAGLIPYLFHRVMIRLPKEVQEEKRDWVFPFQKKANRQQLPVSLKILPLSFLIFALISWFFIPVFFRSFSSFLVKLQSPEPFLNLLWETKKPDFLVFLIAVAALIFLMLADREETEAFSNRRNSATPETEKNTAEDNKTHTDKILPEEVQPVRTAVIQPEKTQPVMETENSTEKKQTNAVPETGSENENISGGKTGKPSKTQEKHSQDANGTHPERKNRRFKSRKYRGTKKWKNENGTKDEGGNGK